jgi:hypothetical protein
MCSGWLLPRACIKVTRLQEQVQAAQEQQQQQGCFQLAVPNAHAALAARPAPQAAAAGDYASPSPSAPAVLCTLLCGLGVCQPGYCGRRPAWKAQGLWGPLELLRLLLGGMCVWGGGASGDINLCQKQHEQGQ